MGKLDADIKVYVIDGDRAYQRMFTDYFGWKIADNLEEADLIQFTGGEDVSPHLYGEPKHRTTSNSRPRDEYEMRIFQQGLILGKAMAGICRGGQFLHVMNGGKMVQDCDNHAIGGTHPAQLLTMTGKTVRVSSTHHQMMRPMEGRSDVITCLYASLSEDKRDGYDNFLKDEIGFDLESCYYTSTRCLSFQPHPEFAVHSDLYYECADTYGHLLLNTVLASPWNLF